MKKIGFALSIFMLFATGCGDKNTKVYICNGPYAKKYHKTSDCKGLYNCSASIDKVSLEEAKNKGKTSCDYCY